MALPADRVHVRIPPVENELHQALSVLQYTLPDAICMRYSEGVQATYDMP
jgi:hypothetical protein